MGLHTIVCIKSVVTRTIGNKIVRTPELSELNFFDRPALETALVLREKHGGTVTALTMGPQVAGSAVLLEAMAMGVDRGVLLADTALAGSDTLATAAALGAAIHHLAPFDLVLFGTRSSDSDTGQVGPQTSVILDLPLVSGVMSLEKIDSNIRAERLCDEFVEIYETGLPAVLTIHPNGIRPRDVSLVGIEQAFGQNRIETITLSDIGLTKEAVGEDGSGTRVRSMRKVKRKRSCTFIEGSVTDQVDALVNDMTKRGLLG
jgi:electron transfer flavoprotein beta subunit